MRPLKIDIYDEEGQYIVGSTVEACLQNCFTGRSKREDHSHTGERYCFFYLDKAIVKITPRNHQQYLISSSLDDLERMMDPDLFYRANRQSIIHADAIQSVKPHENQKLTITLKAPLKMEMDISREKAPAFKKWFDR